MSTVLITGANRGIGLALAKIYAGRGDRVHACCRKPGAADALKTLAKDHDVQIHELDVTDHAQVDGLAEELSGEAIDRLINNAGIIGGTGRDVGGTRDQEFGNIGYGGFRKTLEVNTLAPLKMAEAFYPHVKNSGEKKIITITSKMGSIDDTSGGYYAYRTSKAAVNMVMKALSNDAADDDIKVLLLHPGWVATDMGTRQAPVDPDDSAAGLIKRMDELDSAMSGKFYDFEGKEVPW